MRIFGKNADDQLRLERKRFAQKQRPKPVLADQIKSREIRELKLLKERKEKGQEKIFMEDIL